MGKHSQVTSADYHDPELLHRRRTEEQGACSRFISVKSTWSQRAIVCNALLLQGTVSDHSRTDVGDDGQVSSDAVIINSDPCCD